MPVKINGLISNGNRGDGLNVSGHSDLTLDNITTQGNGRHGISISGADDPTPQQPQEPLPTKREKFATDWWRPTATQTTAGLIVLGVGIVLAYFFGVQV